MTRLTAKRVEELCKQFGDLYINSQPNIYPQVLLDITALCEVALQSLSLESVRSEAQHATLEEACQAIDEAFSDWKFVIDAKAVIRRLKQSPDRKDIHPTELRK